MAPLPVRINQLQFQVDILDGHKTGYYLDQQVNYEPVAHLATGAQVLDCFTFLGGFAPSRRARRRGARPRHRPERGCVGSAERNASAIGLAERCSFEAANVFDWLKEQTKTAAHEKLVPRFDLIVLDPPSFTRNRASIPDALRGYKEIHLRAFKLAEARRHTGHVLLLASHRCRTFQQVILEAAFDARRILRRVAVYAIA